MLPLLATEGQTLLTREVFGNIPSADRFVFYGLAVLAMATFAAGVYRRVRRWRQGQPTVIPSGPQLVGRFCRNVLALARLRGRPLASLAHRMLFYGFIVLFVGTCLIAIEHILADLLGREPGNPVFHKGWYYAVYEVVLDAAGVVFLTGVAVFLWRRSVSDESFARRPADRLVLLLLLAIGVTGYLVEALRLLDNPTRLPGVSPVGWLGALGLESLGMPATSAKLAHYLLWWGHGIMALGFVAAIPYTSLMHAVAGAWNLMLADEKLGVLQPVDLEQVEETGTLGVGVLNDFTQQQLLSLDACVACGRCEDDCPAHEAGKPLSPKRLVQDLARSMATGESQSLHGEVVSAETLWSCTTCNACTSACPLGVSPAGLITDLRRHLIVEGDLRGAPATSLQKTQRSGNPWGLPAGERMKWAAGLEVPTVDECPDFEMLYWVGCAGSFDCRSQQIARSVVQLLHKAGVRFAVLGKQERCTGEAARRMGDELLFQELATQNIATFSKYQVKKIVTHCPHCLNSLRNDYPQFGGEYQVVHHSELLAELLSEGRLSVEQGGLESVTYHDPCYLARTQGVTEPPREILRAAIGGTLPVVEPKRCGESTACCGGGGGRMWFDDAPDARIGNSRVDELIETGSHTIAAACPFCITMLSDGMANRKAPVNVKDIAEVLCEATLPQPNDGIETKE
ncbi:(Fe-S)-binding protein [Aeoliella mucimassa]|uniref:Succinate dehydrogenase/fumarate reductase iron-sulfur subunit n=1 Tax=Aeoliella mucimassa TaxID=2527972 RepID=A0A518AQP6_9BACT|nr:(Fe-S)-binding protein [Aeoliella mucimassa]QDU57044.1 succinate dehydrogenase/fumarate reductase iron-sulfur subunit [Aeoliella mucimassa]